jgi:LPS-assembly lipoprotein
MVVALGPVGCGFQPLYARGDAGEATAATELASIRVQAIPDRAGQQLRNNLVQRLSPRGEQANASYILDVRFSENLSGLAESSDGNATVGVLQLSGSYTLSEARTGKAMTSGSVNSIASMRFLGPRYASVATERDTEELALGDLAEQIRSRLAAWFANGRPMPATTQLK